MRLVRRHSIVRVRPDNQPPHVSTIHQEQVPQAAAVLARTFVNAPQLAFIIPGEPGREVKLRRYYSARIRAALRTGAVHVAARHSQAPIQAVAIWEAPGHTGHTLTTKIVSGLWLALFRLGLSSFRRRRALGPVLDSIRPSEPCWYLSSIGVEPAVQGSGLGTALLETMLQRVDSEGFPCFLDTAAPENLAYYERFGFVVTAESALPNGIPVWGMTRASG